MYLPISRQSVKSFMLMTVPHDQQELHETNRNLMEEYVLGFMYSPVTKISYTLTFCPTSWEQFLRAV